MINANKPPDNDGSSLWERRIGLGLACIVVFAFILFIFLSPDINSTAKAVIRFLAALVAALSAYLYVGSFNLEGSLPFTKIQVRAAGAFAVFLAVFFLFFQSIDNSPPPTDIESQLIKSFELAESDAPNKKVKGINQLAELTVHPHKRQKIIDFLQNELRSQFPQNKEIDESDLPILEHMIRTITTIPRYDVNNHALNFNLHQIRVQDLDLSNINFKDMILWGSQFINVVLSHSDFRNADIGGTIFKNCSLEYADLEGAIITRSFMDSENGRPRPTRFIETRLYESNLEKANIEFGELIGITDFDLESLRDFVNKGKLIIR